MKEESRIMWFCSTLLKTPLQIAIRFRVKSCVMSFELVDLLTYQNRQLRESNIDLKY
jgi:hypothetical protein